MYLLEIEGETNRGTGGLKGEKTTISSPANDPTLILLCELFDVVAVALDQFTGNIIALFRFEKSRPRKVRKEESQDS
jgi:hypothetical protein